MPFYGYRVEVLPSMPIEGTFSIAIMVVTEDMVEKWQLLNSFVSRKKEYFLTVHRPFNVHQTKCEHENSKGTHIFCKLKSNSEIRTIWSNTSTFSSKGHCSGKQQFWFSQVNSLSKSLFHFFILFLHIFHLSFLLLSLSIFLYSLRFS